ncbi:MAG: HEAT repeat domain-containing protein [Planctomycetes bacterium]|nr:HEAT repeat domain-containing protein [Planctomycetota bacterium]
MTSRRTALGIALAAALVPAVGVRADEPGPCYAPVPPTVAAVVGSPEEEALAARAVAALPDADAETLRRAERELLAAGPSGVRHAVERLAAGGLAAPARLALLDVVAASPLADADRVLAAAADEATPEARAVAARGLSAGRSGLAVEALARLARDPTPAVRAAALRGLFAIPSPAAVATRTALPADPVPAVEALRLRLHRLRGDAGPEVAAHALLALSASPDAAARLEGARLAVACGDDVPEATRLVVMLAFAPDLRTALAARAALRAPLGGYDAEGAALAFVEALVAWLGRPTTRGAVRAALTDVAAERLARPVHDGGRTVDGEARELLAMRLGDAGPALVPPIVERLRTGRFEDPADGVRVLLALPRDAATAALAWLATSDAPADVVAHVSGGLRDLGRVGDETTARRLLDPSQPTGVRRDVVLALAGEPGAFALPLLEAALRDDDDDLAGAAKEALLSRGDAPSRAVLDASLLDGRWRRFEADLLHERVRAADDAAFDLLDRLLARGPVVARVAVFDEMKNPASRLRGPRALAIVERAVADPSLGLDATKISSAYTAVDGPRGTAYVRSFWDPRKDPPVPPIMLRNLRVVRAREALDLALEVAAALPDGHPLLSELALVLSEAPAQDPRRTDPFWRRLLTRGTPVLVELALVKLARTEHGPLSDLLVPILSDRGRDARLRQEALVACTGEPGQPPAALLWSIASDRTEDEDLRAAAAEALSGRRDAATRERALAWLAERVDEESETVVRVAAVAAAGASTGEAADLLQMFDDEVASLYETRPYYRSREDEGRTARRARAAALAGAVVATGDAAAAEALASRLLDPRFAAYSAEARRHGAFGRGRGGGPLAALSDPPEAEILLHQAEANPNATPTPAVPREAWAIVRALARRGGDEAPRRVARALAEARASGRLAAFSDLYVVWLALGARTPGAEEDGRPPGTTEDGVASALLSALDRTYPAAGAEETLAAELATARAATAGAWTAAADAADAVATLAARTGLADLAAARWLDRGRRPPPTWLALRARVDLYRAAAAAAAGKLEEARDLRSRALARAPDDAATLRLAASLLLATRTDLAQAERDARRAVELERRRGRTDDDGTTLVARIEAARR